MNTDKIEVTQQEDEAFEAMSKEWDGEGLPPVGVECEYYDKGHSNEWIHVLVKYSSDWGVVIESKSIAVGTELFFNHYEGKKFRKLETTQQREKRERLEAAYDLFVEFKESAGVTGYPTFAKWQATQPTDSWLAIVDKTGYRKA